MPNPEIKQQLKPNQYFYNSTSQWMASYQYRTFSPLKDPKDTQFDQFDIYFYAPKCTGVGVKARFRHKDRNHKHWQVEDLEFKFIENFKQVQTKQQVLQLWRKVHVDADFKVNSPLYISSHPQKFDLVEGSPIQEAIAHEMKRLSKKISKALKHSKIKAKHYQNNEDLRRWLQKENQVQQAFLVDKTKWKCMGREEGKIKASRLYQKPEEEASKIYKTVAYESQSRENLVQLLEHDKVELKDNISYPTFLEGLYFDLL